MNETSSYINVFKIHLPQLHLNFFPKKIVCLHPFDWPEKIYSSGFGFFSSWRVI